MKKILSYATGINLIIVAILINVFLSFYPYLRLDLSKDKIHSLPPATKKIVSNLDDVVNIKVYTTEDLPSQIKPISDDLKTILGEFGRLNKNLKITYYDPNKDTSAKEDADKLGIQQLQFSSLKSDKLEVSTGYFGLALTYGDKKEVLPVAGDVGNMEYFLVSGIKKLINKDIPSIALYEETTGGSSEIQIFRKFLNQNYKINNIKLEGDEKLPESDQVLILVGQNKKLDDKNLTKIQDWLKNNKSLIAFIDKTQVDMNMQAKKNENTGLEPILKDKGIEIETKLVLDQSSAIANFRTQSGAFMVQYPYWVQVRPENMNSIMPVVSGINSIMLPWVSPLKISGDAKPLFTSSDKAVVDDGLTDLSPITKKDLKNDNAGKQVLGAININGAKLAVIGDSDFIKDQFLANSQPNLNLALNLVDYFSQDQSLLSIRSKTLSIHPIVQLDDNMKMIIRIINIGSPIIILTISALVANIIRRKNNKKWFKL